MGGGGKAEASGGSYSCDAWEVLCELEGGLRLHPEQNSSAVQVFLPEPHCRATIHKDSPRAVQGAQRDGAPAPDSIFPVLPKRLECDPSFLPKLLKRNIIEVRICLAAGRPQGVREGIRILFSAVEDSPDPRRVRPLPEHSEEARREVRQPAGGLALLQLGGR